MLILRRLCIGSLLLMASSPTLAGGGRRQTRPGAEGWTELVPSATRSNGRPPRADFDWDKLQIVDVSVMAQKPDLARVPEEDKALYEARPPPGPPLPIQAAESIRVLDGPESRVNCLGDPTSTDSGKFKYDKDHVIDSIKWAAFQANHGKKYYGFPHRVPASWWREDDRGILTYAPGFPANKYRHLAARPDSSGSLPDVWLYPLVSSANNVVPAVFSIYASSDRYARVAYEHRLGSMTARFLGVWTYFGAEEHHNTVCWLQGDIGSGNTAFAFNSAVLRGKWDNVRNSKYSKVKVAGAWVGRSKWSTSLGIGSGDADHRQAIRHEPAPGMYDPNAGYNPDYKSLDKLRYWYTKLKSPFSKEMSVPRMGNNFPHLVFDPVAGRWVGHDRNKARSDMPEPIAPWERWEFAYKQDRNADGPTSFRPSPHPSRDREGPWRQAELRQPREPTSDSTANAASTSRRPAETAEHPVSASAASPGYARRPWGLPPTVPPGFAPGPNPDTARKEASPAWDDDAPWAPSPASPAAIPSDGRPGAAVERSNFQVTAGRSHGRPPRAPAKDPPRRPDAEAEAEVEAGWLPWGTEPRLADEAARMLAEQRAVQRASQPPAFSFFARPLPLPLHDPAPPGKSRPLSALD